LTQSPSLEAIDGEAENVAATTARLQNDLSGVISSKMNSSVTARNDENVWQESPAIMTSPAVTRRREEAGRIAALFVRGPAKWFSWPFDSRRKEGDEAFFVESCQ
jgi:hypothetical protein